MAAGASADQPTGEPNAPNAPVEEALTADTTLDLMNRLVGEVGMLSEQMVKMMARMETLENNSSDITARIISITGDLNLEKDKLLKTVKKEVRFRR